MAGAAGRFVSTERQAHVSALGRRAMATANLTEDILELLGEAAVEIANLDSPSNIVCRRLRAMQQRLKPLTTTVGELAKRIDVSPRDVLDAALAAGIHVFWHEGQQFRTPSYLKTYLSMAYHFDPVPELEFDLTVDQVERLATELDVEVHELTSDESESTAAAGANQSTGRKSPRKFAPSEQTPPNAAERRQQHFG
jgi:hypothetical protein